MLKLTAEQQAKLDIWAIDAAKCADVSTAEYAADGTVLKPSETMSMMEALGPLLTEAVLDAAISKAKKVILVDIGEIDG